MKKCYDKSLYTIGSLRKSIRFFRKYNISYLDFIYILANCSIPNSLVSIRNLRDIKDVRDNKFIDELKLHSERFAITQDFKDSYSMYEFANNTVLILLLLVLCTGVLCFSINHSYIDYSHRSLASLGCIAFILFLYYRMKQHYSYLMFSCVLYPIKLKFKITRFLSCTLFKGVCCFSIILSVLTVLNFRFL